MSGETRADTDQPKAEATPDNATTEPSIPKESSVPKPENVTEETIEQIVTRRKVQPQKNTPARLRSFLLFDGARHLGPPDVPN